MVKTTTNNLLEGKVRQHADDRSKTVEIDPGFELYSRIIEDIRALAAASDWEAVNGAPAMARIHWSALAIELATTGILDRLNAQFDNLTTTDHLPSPKRIAPTVSLGEAMHLFFDGADAHDFSLKNRLVDAFMSATENLDGGLTGRHWGMAVALPDVSSVVGFGNSSLKTEKDWREFTDKFVQAQAAAVEQQKQAELESIRQQRQKEADAEARVLAAEHRLHDCLLNLKEGDPASKVYRCGSPDHTNSDLHGDQLVYPDDVFVYIDKATNTVSNVQWKQ